MAPRANWKGFLKLAEIVCPVSLFTAASTSERVTFHILNRKTGHRVHREFVDAETGDRVDSKDQVKGYETGDGDYIALEPREIAAAAPEADKTLCVQAFIPCDGVDDLYFDRPYYLAPSDAAGSEAFVALREAMRAAKLAAIARAVLFRRMRSVLIRADEIGLLATTLKFDYEVRSAEDAFSEVPATPIAGEMLDLALHIIRTKAGRFDPKAFDDRYEEALAELVKAKIEGRKIAPPAAPQPANVVDLMEALRQSAKLRGAAAARPQKAPTQKAPTQKAPAREPAARKPAARRKAG
jgi:DNA end-binding protein Ku